MDTRDKPGYDESHDRQTGSSHHAPQDSRHRFLSAVVRRPPALAVEQCRFIQAKPEREACYQRQEAELAARRKPEPPRESKFMEQLQQMKHEDEALDRQIHSICRGC